MRAETDDYQVGYGRPPKESRFKPGYSGNPKGRPKGVRNFKTDVQAALKEPVGVTRAGKAHRVSTQLAAILRLREKALNGNARALDGLLTLARLYNNEDSLEVSRLSNNDAEVLELYNARVLRGATATPTPSDSSECLGETSQATSRADQATSTRKRKVKRIRLRRIKP